MSGPIRRLAGTLPSAFFTTGVSVASGALSAFSQFLSRLSSAPGYVIVVVHAEDAEGLQRLLTLVEDNCALPVRVIDADTQLLPNHVFVAPPGCSVSFRDATTCSPTEVGSIDSIATTAHLFAQMAQALQDAAIGVVLTEDPDRIHDRLNAISDVGGLVLIQKHAPDRNREAPNLMTLRLADDFLPPDQMPAEIHAHLRIFQSEAQIAQKRLATEHTVTRILVNARSLSEIECQILQEIRQCLGARVGMLWLPDLSGKLRCSATDVDQNATNLGPFLERSLEAGFDVGEGLPGSVAKTRRPGWVEDVQNQGNFQRADVAAECGLFSGIAMPVVSGDECHGVLEFFTDRPMSRDPLLAGMLGSIGGEIALFLRRYDADQKIRDAESRKSAILAVALDCIITMDMQGRIVDFNPAAERTFGISAEDAQGQSLADAILPEEYREQHREGLKIFLTTGESVILDQRIEVTGQRANGERFPVELTVHASTTREGQPFFTGYLRDITTRKAAENRLAQRANLSMLHSALAVTLSGDADLSEILQNCCQHFIDRLDAAFARVWLWNHADNVLELTASAGLYTHIDGSFSRIKPGQYKIGQIAEEGVPSTTNDVQHDPAVSDPEWARKENMTAFAGYPLIVEGRGLGVVALFSRRPLSAEVFAQMRTMSDAMAQCISRKASDERTRRSEQLLREHQQQLVKLLTEYEATNAKLRVLFDQSFYFAGILDLDGTVIDINDTALDRCGYTRADMIGKLFWETAWWTGSRDVQQTIQQAAAKAVNGVPFRAELPYWLSDGTRCMVDFAITPARNENGEVIFILPTGADITQRTEAAAREARQAEIEQFLSDAGTTLASSLDLDRTLKQFTELCVPTLADWAFVDLIEDNAVKRVAVAHADQDHAELAQQVANFPAVENRLDHPPARGLFGADGFVISEFTEDMLVKAAQSSEHEHVIRQVNPKSFVVVPLVARGFTLGALTLITSASGRRLGERDLSLAEELGRRAAIAIDNARLFEEAHRASSAKSEFLANMSHEIRTPMTAVLGYTDLLLARETDSEKSEFLSTIRRNGNFLLAIINDILDLSKIEAGKMELSPEPMSVPDVIEDVRSMMLVRAAEKNLTFDVKYKGPIPLRIQSDPHRIRQILINLTGNAVKFTEEGGVNVVVSYQSECSPPQIRFEISDTGVGIPRDQIKRLFQPFTQGDASVSRTFGGTGLGLVISQRLAGMLGGEITVVSQPGRGSTFTCAIEALGAEDVSLIHPALKTLPADSPETAPDLTLSCRILVVDDRRDVRFLSKHILNKAGAKVDFAEDGIQAIERIERMQSGEHHFDLILLDMQMPRLDGYRTAKRLREMGFDRPIIALTADAMQGDMERCLEHGCNAHLSKPIDVGALLRVVHQFTAR